jgi:DNA polymerase-3 subunit epsilon
MREVVMDTETTGLDPKDGHKIVEIGAVELLNHLPTGKTFHSYLNPQRPVPKEAFDVHGLNNSFLKDKPLFKNVAVELLDFIEDSPLVIHNAKFDMKFLNAELVSVGLATLSLERALDTLAMARQKFPGSPASLDALCRRFGVNSLKREKHGALLDSEILAEVYLELIGGRQPELIMTTTASLSFSTQKNSKTKVRPTPLKALITKSEAEAHEEFCKSLKGEGLWKNFPN